MGRTFPCLVRVVLEFPHPSHCRARRWAPWLSYAPKHTLSSLILIEGLHTLSACPFMACNGCCAQAFSWLLVCLGGVQDNALLGVVDGRRWVGVLTRAGVQVRRGSTTLNLRLWRSPLFCSSYEEHRWCFVAAATSNACCINDGKAFAQTWCWVLAQIIFELQYASSKSYGACHNKSAACYNVYQDYVRKATRRSWWSGMLDGPMSTLYLNRRPTSVGVFPLHQKSCIHRLVALLHWLKLPQSYKSSQRHIERPWALIDQFPRPT